MIFQPPGTAVSRGVRCGVDQALRVSRLVSAISLTVAPPAFTSIGTMNE
jgi:hypothetical protein